MTDPTTDGAHLDPFEVLAQLSEGGGIARTLGLYEDRPSQRDLAAHITDTYNAGGVALLEAGTGVGKSFAYLVPALAWARLTGERTIVSTNTINLQEQLVRKDLPLLGEALADGDYRPSWAMLKGWHNYVCRQRLEHAVGAQHSLLEGDRLAELLDVVAWAETTKDGTRADFTVAPSPEVWDEVAAEADLCLRQACPHYDRCFVFQARRRAAAADVIVVNHSLLAADLAIRHQAENWEDSAVLPTWHRLILDEAHHLEDTAAKHLGVQCTNRGVLRLLQRLERQGKGLLPALYHDLTSAHDLLSRASLDLLRERITPAVADARRQAETLFLLLFDLLGDGIGQRRLGDDFAQDPVWEHGLTAALAGSVAAFQGLANQIETIADRLAQSEVTERRAQLLHECRGVIRRLAAIAEALEVTLRPPAGRPPEVRWIERVGGRAPTLRLSAVPLDLAPLLQDLLFDRAKTIVLTSATLSTGGDFSFLRARLGLADSGRTRVEESCPSPFDYGAQCLLGVPDDLPDPQADEYAHHTAVVQVVTDLAQAGDGGLFVLFTSHAALRRCAVSLRERLGDTFPVLVQGETGRDHLLQTFRRSGRGILLGTDSFWEGVDVPGRALRGLVLAKLPFKVPSEPLTAARLERLAEQGENGFQGYLLPHASLKLKQGFGRLIRSAQDVGVVLVLDRRIVQRSYGAFLLDSLPPATRVTGPWRQVLNACEDFYAHHGIGATL